MLEGVLKIDCHAAARAVEANFVETWWVVASAYGAELHDDDGLRWFSFSGPNLDPRASSVVRTTLADHAADETIDTVLRQLKAAGGPAVWWTSRLSRPADLAKRLASRGLEPWPAWPGMAMDLDALPPPPVHDDFAIEVVRSPEQLYDLLSVLESLGMRGIFTGAFERMAADGGLGPDQPFEHFIGRTSDGRAVACASLCTAGNAAGLYAVAVAEDARRRGFGRAVSLAALQAGADGGHRFGVLQSSQLGFSVYRGIGLTLVCRLQAYEVPAA